MAGENASHAPHVSPSALNATSVTVESASDAARATGTLSELIADRPPASVIVSWGGILAGRVWTTSRNVPSIADAPLRST